MPEAFRALPAPSSEASTGASFWLGSSCPAPGSRQFLLIISSSTTSSRLSRDSWGDIEDFGTWMLYLSLMRPMMASAVAGPCCLRTVTIISLRVGRFPRALPLARGFPPSSASRATRSSRSSRFNAAIWLAISACRVAINSRSVVMSPPRRRLVAPLLSESREACNCEINQPPCWRAPSTDNPPWQDLREKHSQCNQTEPRVNHVRPGDNSEE